MTFEYDLKASVRTIPDYPKPGILFRDITTLLGDARSFRRAVDELVQPWAGNKIEKVAGIEARGFILGAAVAMEAGVGFVPARRPGKLPPETISVTYALEYGQNSLELHPDLIPNGSKVIIHDDVLATGGTVEGIRKLVEQLGGVVVGTCFIIELTFLDGRKRLEGTDVHALITY